MNPLPLSPASPEQPDSAPPLDSRALLCEQCGYPIDAVIDPQIDAPVEPPPAFPLTPTTAAPTAVNARAENVPAASDRPSSCPECGRDTDSSLPASRPGSPWQRRIGISPWIATAWMTLRHPITLFQNIRVERRGATALLWINLTLGAAAIVAPWSGALIGDPLRAARGQSLFKQFTVAIVALPAQVAAVALVLFALTFIEFLGIRFIANRRGWRLLPDAARQICAHASLGWIACGILPLVTLFGFEFVLRVFGVSPGGTIDAGPVLGTFDMHRLAIGGSAVAGYIAGMLLFETLVFLGVRQCRFANQFHPPLRPGPPLRPDLDAA